MAGVKGAERRAGGTPRKKAADDRDQLICELKKENLFLREELRARNEELENQAEELEAQLEELRVNNDELEKQIEERRRAEETASQLASIVTSSDDAIIMITWDGIITSWNEGAERLYGYSEAEAVSMPVDIIVPPDRQQELRDFRGRIQRGERVKHYEAVGRTKDDRRVDVSVTVSPTIDAAGRLTGVSLIARDITEHKQAEKALQDQQEELETQAEELEAQTEELRANNDELERQIEERKRAEEALRESEERFRQLADYSPFPMAIVDKDDNITYVNKKSVEVFGYSPEDIPNLKYWWPLAYPDPMYRDDAIKRWKKGVRDAVKEPKKIRPLDYTVTCNDGSVRYTEIYGAPIGDMELVLLQDITERKRAEAELESSKQEAELYLDLMGHDINNMHQIALGYLELASNMQPGEEQTAFINKSAEVLQRSTRLIGNVRKMQKLHDGTFQTQDIDVIPVLRDIQHEYGGIPNKHIILNLNGCEHCYVRANELLHDVYANLITNAIKHTGDRADVVINADVVKNNGNQYCLVIVEDNGPGIPDDKKAIIFNRTLKGTNKAKGMGIGLYIVKALVDSYSGRVWVEDRVSGDQSKGARFMVMLPVVEKCL